eukprot:6196221-Pleurochrysis_carterae.AAC.3
MRRVSGTTSRCPNCCIWSGSLFAPSAAVAQAAAQAAAEEAVDAAQFAVHLAVDAMQRNTALLRNEHMASIPAFFVLNSGSRSCPDTFVIVADIQAARKTSNLDARNSAFSVRLRLSYMLLRVSLFLPGVAAAGDEARGDSEGDSVWNTRLGCTTARPGWRWGSCT